MAAACRCLTSDTFPGLSLLSELQYPALATWRRDQGEAWGNEPLWAVQRPHKSRLELEQEAWRRAVRLLWSLKPLSVLRSLVVC
jgi:hypothetical protein